MTGPKVVVACAWYNRADYIRDTLDSLLQQDFDSFEVVLVNDASPDPRVREILDSYDDVRLKVVHQEKNTGFVRAIRNAISLSSAPYVAIQGAGDISLPARLRKQYEILSGDRNISVVGSYYKNFKVSDDSEVESDIVESPQFPDFSYCLKKNPFSHGEVMFSRSAYEEVGGYREFFKFAQDRDLWLRMSQKNFNFMVIQEVLYFRRNFRKDGVSTDLDKALHQIMLSEIAVKDAVFRHKFGISFVDETGPLSYLFRPRNLRTTKLLIGAAMISKIKRDDAKFRTMSRLALDEGFLAKVLYFVLIKMRVVDLLMVLKSRYDFDVGFMKKIDRYNNGHSR